MNDKTFSVLINDLKSDNFDAAYQAALSLDDLKMQEAAPHLMEVILDPSKRNLASVCLLALRQINERAYFADLTKKVLNDQDISKKEIKELGCYV